MLIVEEFTGEAIQAKLDEAAQDRTGPVMLLPEIYRATEPIRLPKGAALIGAYPASFTGPDQGTILRATKNMDALITTGLQTAREGYYLSRFLVDGNHSLGIQVGRGLELFGRKIRIEAVDVANVTGTGVHFEPSKGNSRCWVNWMSRCSIGRCEGKGIENHSSDSWFSDNYFSGCPVSEEHVGGNSWIGNHFDSTWRFTKPKEEVEDDDVVVLEEENGNVVVERRERGLRVIASGDEGSGSRFIGNYFDMCRTGLELTGGSNGSRWTWFALVSDNFFRANDVDVRVENAKGVHITGSHHRQGDRSRYALSFDNCFGGLIDGCRFDPRYALFEERDPSVRVRNCMVGPNFLEQD